MTSLVNTETGEIVETTALAPVNTGSEIAVTSYLAQARDWLARAVDETGPEQIAAAKAEIATAAEATKQLGLSKEIQEDAAEMVRRAQYALGKAIRKAQSEGTVAAHGGHRHTSSPDGQDLRPMTDFATNGELYGRGSDGILHLAEIPEDDFESALAEARAEGNLSRANVARKAREASAPSRSTPRPAAERTLALIQSLAAKAARESQTLTPDQIRRVKADAGHIETSIRQSIEALQRLADALTNQEDK